MSNIRHVSHVSHVSFLMFLKSLSYLIFDFTVFDFAQIAFWMEDVEVQIIACAQAKDVTAARRQRRQR